MGANAEASPARAYDLNGLRWFILKRWPRAWYLITNSPRLLFYEVCYRLWPSKQFHIVRTGLSPGYYDPDTVMMHAMMACLKRYIEAMGGIEELERWADELFDLYEEGSSARDAALAQSRSEAEATIIWRWWSETRPREHLAHDKECMRLFGDPQRGPHWDAEVNAHHNEERRLQNQDEEMLVRLVRLRNHLWT